MSFFSLFEAHNYQLTPHEYAQFELLLQYFLEYNAHTNLSAIRTPHEIVEKHYIDSLYGASIIHDSLQHISERPFRVLDIGSGGGFPGIPLKIVLPEISLTMLDSVGKKTRATRYFSEMLNLQNTESLQARAEMLGKDPAHQ